MRIALSTIVIDESVFPRAKLSPHHIARLRSALESGTHLPPLIIEARTNKLVDGRHRYEAYTEEGVDRVDVTTKVYNNEAELFADAVRLNIEHGQPLDFYTIKNAVLRLTNYGYTREQIVAIVRLPPIKLDEIERSFAFSQTDDAPIVLKGGLSHMRGHRLDERQQKVNRRYGGPKATFYANQIVDLLRNEMWPETANFISAMDQLVELWSAIRRQQRDEHDPASDRH